MEYEIYRCIAGKSLIFGTEKDTGVVSRPKTNNMWYSQSPPLTHTPLSTLPHSRTFYPHNGAPPQVTVPIESGDIKHLFSTNSKLISRENFL